MTEKVKLTKEQADAIERYRKEHGTTFLMNAHSIRSWSRNMKPCNKLNNDEMARALYVGYEVEPEFKVGDWVRVEFKDSELRSRCGQITKLTGNTLHLNGDQNMIGAIYYKCGLTEPFIKKLSLEEIAEEKECRFFAKHGRKPWELRIDDILYYDNELFTVTKAMDEIHLNFSPVKLDVIKKYFSVVCFAEDRKDIEQ